MEKLKDIKIKHNHTLTDILKVAIFSMVMLAPMFSILTRCLYVVCNKNAYQSASITQAYTENIYQYETNAVNSIDDIIVGRAYEFEMITQLGAENEVYNEVSNVNQGLLGYTITNSMAVIYPTRNYADGIKYYSTRITTSSNNILLNSNPNFQNRYSGAASYRYSIYVVIEDKTGMDINKPNLSVKECPLKWIPFTTEEHTQQTLDNVFEYSVEQLGYEQTFSWTKSTALYNSINAMTTQLGINNNNNTIAILLTYWFIVMLIYIVVDIIVVLITKMTHLN